MIKKSELKTFVFLFVLKVITAYKQESNKTEIKTLYDEYKVLPYTSA